MPAPTNNGPVIERMSVEQLHELMEQGEESGASPLLIDVREPYEFESAHLDGAVNIPLGELPMHLGTIARNAHPVFICQVGGRSLAACQMALQAGIASAVNVEGGMMAWLQTYSE